MGYYVHQNWDLFTMAAEHFGIPFGSIDCVDRKTRTVHLYDGTVLTMPDDWNLD